jgi:uncharacterized protein
VRIVLDTNVLVSGLLTPFGTCGEIVRLLTTGEIILCVDARILLEYGDVLHRSRFAIATQKADVVLEYIRDSGHFPATAPVDGTLPDVDDIPFLEVALSAKAQCLVTGNLKHFPPLHRAGVRVLSPAEFLDFFRRHRTRHADDR